ncbi:MAG: nicotinamide riboside transporter PnuC [Moraxella sp.]|nr:nicotinamide riboside transporter PnuC [Moraxella sp.]
MRIDILDNITGFGTKDWTKQWIVTWLVFGALTLFVGFWQATTHRPLDWLYLLVSYVGLLCVAGLSFRKNMAGNGFGILATAGEVVVQGTAGAVGLMLAPLFNFFTHVYGVIYWQKNTDADGDMLPKSANKYVWVITILFIITGLSLFPMVNAWLATEGFMVIDDNPNKLFGVVSFFWANVLAFVLSIAAQAAMIMRYSLSWWLWIGVNFVWFVVNILSGNYIFAIQTCVYQINSVIGLYGWQRSEQLSQKSAMLG